MKAANDLKRALCALAVASAASCSLMVDYDLEGKPCGNAQKCLPGYVCIQNGCWRFDEDASAPATKRDAGASRDASSDAAAAGDAASPLDAADESDAGLDVPDV